MARTTSQVDGGAAELRAAARRIAAEADVDPRTAAKALALGASSIRVDSVRERVIAAARGLRIRLPD